MDFAAKHAGFVLAAYAISAIVLVALCAWTIRRDRNLKKQLNRREDGNSHG